MDQQNFCQGRHGILFENDKKGELSNSLIKYANLKDIKKHKFEIKKNTKQYTKYRHFLKLKNILKKILISLFD